MFESLFEAVALLRLPVQIAVFSFEFHNHWEMHGILLFEQDTQVGRDREHEEPLLLGTFAWNFIIYFVTVRPRINQI